MTLPSPHPTPPCGSPPATDVTARDLVTVLGNLVDNAFKYGRDGGYVHVTMGTLIDTPSIRPTAHIFVGSKAPWFEICDALPQFEEFPTE